MHVQDAQTNIQAEHHTHKIKIKVQKKDLDSPSVDLSPCSTDKQDSGESWLVCRLKAPLVSDRVIEGGRRKSHLESGRV